MLCLRLADLPDEVLEALAGLVVGAQLRQDPGRLLHRLVHHDLSTTGGKVVGVAEHYCHAPHVRSASY